jgi:hypothetical protein
VEAKSSAYYQRRHRERLREKGLVKKEVWVLPEYAEELAVTERRMRQPRGAVSLPAHNLGRSDVNEAKLWTATGLYEALSATEQAAAGGIGLELLEGVEPSLLITMHEYGDLPLFLAVGGEQIVVEALLWPVEQVLDPDRFNREVLRTHKLFPLSMIGIQAGVEGGEHYIMFGSLSGASTLSDIVFEIEMLADNVIKATEAYEPHLQLAA